jgi:hypothetical protein
MKKTDVEKYIENEFQFLESEYDFKRNYSKKIDGGFEFLFLNKTTAVCITYEFREGYLFILLYRLLDGEFKRNPIRITAETELTGFGLDDIILLHNKDAIVKPVYTYGEKSEYYTEKDGLRHYFRLFADNLKKYGSDILSGKFDDFVGADKIVKARIS